jgi:hypothetical protein
MYLSEETWRKGGLRDSSNISFYTSVGNMFPNCLKYADKLKVIAKEKDINVHFGHTIHKVDKNNRVATFKTGSDELVNVDYDFLHLVPP